MKLLFASLLLLTGCSSTTYVGSLGEYQKVCDKHKVVTCTADIRTSNDGIEAQVFFYRTRLGVVDKTKTMGLLNVTPTELDRVLSALEVK